MKRTLFIFTAILLALAFHTTAQIPRTLSYQGVLTDNAGKPRPDASYTFTFRLYTSPTGGAAIWSESKSLSVKSGLFSTVLGEQTPFGAAIKFDQQYWLGIQVGNEPELSPRIALTSVGYSFSSLRADTASVSVASLADTTWKHSGANIYRQNGNVGIGTTNPLDKLSVVGASGNEVFSTSLSGNAISFSRPTGEESYIDKTDDGPITFRVGGDYKSVMTIRGNGNVGIGTTNPSDKLSVEGKFGNEVFSTSLGGNGISFSRPTGGESYIDKTDEGPITFRMGGSYKSVMSIRGNGLDVVGRTKTCVLEITGGCDLAEPFEMSENQPIPKGALVIIDEENPGRLKLSHQAYDKRVAGVVSGAGGINPGLTLTQEGVLEGGQNVALSGRVYALATAANGPIKPGDLLTTSEVPGHAMKATDHERAYGAVIGKAMSSLEKGEGLVLVLVNLQ